VGGAGSRLADHARGMDMTQRPLVLIPPPGERVSNSPGPSSLAIEAKFLEKVEPPPHRSSWGRAPGGVAQETNAVQLALANERLRVDQQPRFPLGAQDVPTMQVLVHEKCRVPIDTTKHIDREIDQSPLERPSTKLVQPWNILDPPLRLLRQQPERMRLGQRSRQPRKQVGHDGMLINSRIPQCCARPAAFDHERAARVVPSENANRSFPAPAVERLDLMISLDV
jgi:hypothetical protein